VHALLNKASSVLALALLIVVTGAAAIGPSIAAASVAGTADPGLTLTATPSTVRSDHSSKIVAHISVPGATLQVARRYADESEFTWVRTLTTDADGGASWEPRVRRTVTYRVEFAGTAEWAPAYAEARVEVRPKVTLTTTADGAVFTGDRVTLRVRVAPDRPGGVVEMQRWDSGVGTWAVLRSLTLDGDSKARWVWRPSQAGRHKLRARFAADAEHVAAVSGVRKLEVFDASNPYGVPSTYPHLILIDLSQYKLYYYEHGRVVRVFDCVLGRPSLPTPRGHYHIYAKDAHMYGPYGPRRMRYLGAYAIHGTNEPWLLSRYPRNYSHGCTRLSNSHILWLFDRVHVGTPVWNVP
jgi:L,D-transpeptidase catalytic domain